MTHTEDIHLVEVFEQTLRALRPELNLAPVMAAARYAAVAHREIGQERKYVGGPYIVHPLEVAVLVAQAGGTTTAIAAAVLHDVVEDTPRALADVEAAFGTHVARVVEALTDTSTPADGNRAARKAKDRARLAASGADAQTVKLADLISNSRSIIEHDLSFAPVYLREKAALLEVLTLGEAILWSRARDVLADGLARLDLSHLALQPGTGHTMMLDHRDTR
jgi:(p)ppGpp synthase/HD superfamily hydrolase